jgi:hypothetical protein
MLAGVDGKPLTYINFFQAHLMAQDMGIRLADDLEHNELVHTNSDVARQMRNRAVWTSFVKDVAKASKGDGYTGKIISRPVVEFVDKELVVRGTEKPRHFPNDGWVPISHLLQSDDGLAHVTYSDSDKPEEPCAYHSISPGSHPVFRGDRGLRERGEFNANACWGPLDPFSGVGARVAGDTEFQPIVPATANALEAIERISRRYGMEPADIAARLKF